MMPTAETSLSAQLSKPGDADLGADQHLTPLFPRETPFTSADWQRLRPQLYRQWRDLLGRPSFDAFDRQVEPVGQVEFPEFSGLLVRQPTGPDTRQLVLVMEPKEVKLSPRPGAVVPFYHPDDMAGYDLTTGARLDAAPTIQFGLHLVRQGYVVCCPEAFPYNTVPEPQENAGFAWWQAAAEKVLQDNPHWTGMGKLVHDTSCAVDLLLSQADIDRNRILLIGHSLGGKMVFYTGCLDSRIRAIIASDFGIGWSFTNWDAPWYLGKRIHATGFALAHHQLLALHAPWPFLLLAGEYDRRESRQYLQAAQVAYRLYGRETAVGMIDHARGHRPPQEAMTLAYRWLAEQFALPFRLRA